MSKSQQPYRMSRTSSQDHASCIQSIKACRTRAGRTHKQRAHKANEVAAAWLSEALGVLPSA